MFTVTTPATNTDLTVLATVKSALNIASGDTSEDDYLGKQIKIASAAVCSYIRVPQANDGSRSLASEELVETFRFERDSHHYPGGVGASNPRKHLVLARRPATAIASVVEGTRMLDASEYELSGPAGLLMRLRCDRISSWSSCAKVVVSFTAGWVLPNDAENRTLPEDIEGAVVDLIKMARASRTRDPLVKSLQVVDVDTTEFWVGGINQGGTLPPDIAGRLDRYRYTARL